MTPKRTNTSAPDVGDRDPPVKAIVRDSPTSCSGATAPDGMAPVGMRARCVSTHHCLCPGLCGGCAGGRRRRSSSPAVCAWRRRLAWGRCSEAADGTRAEPSPSPPAHRLRPSWSACRPGRRAAEGDACQSDGPVAVATDGERGQRTAAACPRSSPDEMLTTQQIQFNLSRNRTTRLIGTRPTGSKLPL